MSEAKERKFKSDGNDGTWVIKPGEDHVIFRDICGHESTSCFIVDEITAGAGFVELIEESEPTTELAALRQFFAEFRSAFALSGNAQQMALQRAKTKCLRATEVTEKQTN